MKKYNTPDFEVVEVVVSDIITTSPGTETSKKDETDGIWDLNHYSFSLKGIFRLDHKWRYRV